MAEIQGRVRASLRARLRAAGATEFADEALFAEVEALFRQALSNDDRGALILPPLLPDDWQPELSLRLASHRGRLGSVIVFFKRRLLLPLARWLFEYTLENFRRQHRLNLALMACLQALAIDNVRLRRELAGNSVPPQAAAGGGSAGESAAPPEDGGRLRSGGGSGTSLAPLA
jgi:hypothetical protein